MQDVNRENWVVEGGNWLWMKSFLPLKLFLSILNFKKYIIVKSVSGKVSAGKRGRLIE